MKELRKRTRRSARTVYRMIESKKAAHDNLITTEQAAIALAGEVGIDVSKIVPVDELQKVRNAVAKAPRISVVSPRPARRSKDRGVVIDVSQGLRFEEPVLPKQLATEAERMTHIYPVIYVFENSARNLITHVLEKKHGVNWWTESVSREIQRKVKKRRDREEKIRWHGKRGAHKIFYTDMGDLARIINANWKEFEQILEDLPWVKTCFSTIEHSRNVVAHSNPLTQTDISRIKMYFDDWVKQIKNFSEQLERGESRE